jgi:PKD repeat protein
VVALGCAGGGASASQPLPGDLGVSATIYGAGSQVSTSSVTLQQLVNEGCPQYTFQHDAYADSGGVPGSPIWSLWGVLGCMSGVDENPQISVVVYKSQGGREASLDGAELQPENSAFEYGDAPIVATDRTYAEYYRPARDASDDNGADNVQTSTLEVDVYEGGTLTVVPQASATSISAGATVTFTSNVTGGTDYDWNFDQVAPDSSAANPPPVTFPSGGNYPVSLEAWNPATGAGGSGTVTINVTSPNPPPTTTGTTPNNSNGTNTNPAAPNNGPAKGNQKPTSPASPSTHPRTQQHSNTHQGNKVHKHKTPTTQTQTTSQTTTTTPTAGASGGSGSDNTGSGQSAPSTTSAPNSPGITPAHAKSHLPSPSTTKPLAPEPPPPNAPVVSGRLISDVILLPAAASPLVSTVAAATPTAMRQGVRASVLPILGGVAAVVLLLGLGAARELRGRRGLRFGS